MAQFPDAPPFQNQKFGLAVQRTTLEQRQLVGVRPAAEVESFRQFFVCGPVTFEKEPSRSAENVQLRRCFVEVPLSGCLYKGVETLPQEPSDLS